MPNKRVKPLHSVSARRLLRLLDAYVESCRPAPDAAAKKATARLATLAGFCRFLGCGMSDMKSLGHEDPALFERISAVLEDEVLNFSPSPTLLSAYLKKRLGYAEERSEREKETDCGEVRLIFEHDIEEDGA